jgi:polyisoprenoid-binding protein YceI
MRLPTPRQSPGFGVRFATRCLKRKNSATKISENGAGLPVDTHRSLESMEDRTLKHSFTRSILAALIALATPTLVHADNWQIDPMHTSVEFTVRHMMISNIKGDFEKTSGTITTAGEVPDTVVIDATIDASSINTRVEKRDADLKGPNFLDVKKFPTITFKSTKIEKAGTAKWKVTGNLTLHGVSKEVVLDVDGPTAPIKDPFGNMRSGASATTKINRSDFGLTYNKALETGGVMVGDEVAITIDVEAIKK